MVDVTNSSQSFEPNFEQMNAHAELLKALAHPVRLCIVHGLLSSKGCNVSHMQQCLKLPQSTVSQHLARLKAAGIIVGVRHGLEVHYQVANSRVAKVVLALIEPND